MTARRLGGALAAAVVALALLGACGSDDKQSATATEETYVTVPAAQVTAGLTGTQAAMDALGAAPATANKAAVDAVNNSWLVYEGNIRIDDAQAYLDAEDALALFIKAAGTADGAGMTSAADKFRTMAQAYAAAHPG
jgi:major membrane immunogen (membrane-anchored lipoprotein)